jgi:hypothetical protein
MEMPENSFFPWLPDRGSQGGEQRHSPVRHATRIGDAERDAAAQELGDHFAAGRLTIEELHERLSLVLSAQTRGHLIRVMADLPAPHQATFRVAPPPAPALARDASHEQDNSGDTAGKVGAIALLLLAILIWLFTALLFAGHGYGYYHVPHPAPHYPPPWWQQ